MKKKWFKKENETPSPNDSESLSEFQDELDKSIREEQTQVIMNKKRESRFKAMVRLLLDGGYTIDEINTLLKSKKTYGLVEGEIIEKG